MNMTAKFDGTCRACGGPLPKGTVIDWTRETGARHATLNDCAKSKATRAAIGATVNPAVTVSGAPIATFLRAARDRGLKFPKVAFLGPDNAELALSLAGAKSTNPGAVFVKVDGEFIGSICADDSVRGKLARRSDLLALLNTIAANPAAAAAAYGKVRGACSFCHKSLTDDRSGGSIEVGYGPICARKYGLPHHPTGKARVARPLSEAELAAVVAAEEFNSVDRLFSDPLELDAE